MKKIIIFNTAFFFCCCCCFAQADTLIMKQQKGFLFLTNYNYQYDCNGCEVRSLGFHDFFSPSDCINPKCFLDSNMTTVFKNGLRVEFIKNRKPLKDKAAVFACIDTSRCYSFDRFYIIPVTIDYKIFSDYAPYVCRRNYYELEVVKGGRFRFEYLHQAIKPFQINPTQNAVKKK